MVAHTCDRSHWEVEAGGMPQAGGQPGFHETLSQKSHDKEITEETA